MKGNLLDTYLTFHIWTEYIIPVIFLLILLVVVVVVKTKQILPTYFKIRMLRKLGYKREIKDVASFGTYVSYKWVNKELDRSFSEYTIDNTDYKTLKILAQ